MTKSSLVLKIQALPDDNTFLFLSQVTGLIREELKTFEFVTEEKESYKHSAGEWLELSQVYLEALT